MRRVFDAVIVGGGNGVRMGENKVFLPLGTESVLRRSVQAFCGVLGIARIIVVLKEQDIAAARSLLSDIDEIVFVKGGENRTASVQNGLAEVTAPIVLIHDGARPFVRPNHIAMLANSAEKYGSAIPALAVTDSVCECENGCIVSGFPREKLCTVSTPQAFNTAEIKRAFALKGNASFTDESQLYSTFIKPAHIVEGDPENRKLTTPADYVGTQIKIGSGYDLHRLSEGNKLVLCGIEIDSPLGIVAHSDGDLCLHALIDALFSAIGERDIGTHFSDTDPQFKGIASTILLEKALCIFANHNRRIQTVNLIIIADNPKLQPHIEAMRNNLSTLLNISQTNISISAKTTEKTAPNTISCHALITIL
ncbi:MAG: 2-C-methyl-D-erythritol 2,4-cyclodiphosphate synthase [Bacillota bacterium]